ncbi:MAG: M3 family metallopeptidase [Acidobacteria bacterium]|nr:M3 family metallopeptidase [Acidobacteriota bacterium]
MKELLLLLALAALLLAGCSRSASRPDVPDNPLLVEFDTPFGVPPFNRLQADHYPPAFVAGMERQQVEIAAIAADSRPPDFENTIAALDASGELLQRVSGVFNNLLEAHTSDRLQQIAQDVAPQLARHSDDILMNAALFQRIRAVYDRRTSLSLTPEQQTLLEKTYRDFVRSGAGLPSDKQARLRDINQELAVLSLQFGEHILKEDNAFELVIEIRSDLAGLPDGVIAAAAEAAAERGHAGRWVFTLHKPSLIPFLQYADRRDLREKMFTAYINRGSHGNELDNKAIVAKIAALRLERANLLGYPTHAHYILQENMAQTPDKVYALLRRIWEPALRRARAEAQDLQALIRDEGGEFALQPWDWWYYTEKLRKARYDLDEEMLRPYFQLEKVRAGVFMVANRLYGIVLEELPDVPRYHPDVTVFEVKEADGTHIGVLYTDYFPRASKRGGAWMDAFRQQHRRDGRNVPPIICNVGNFSKPTADNPSLLSLDETLTMFHEFGHALHGLLSDCAYLRLSGTDVAQDFVELPSQIMEHWALEPEVLKMYAHHYRTGEPMPDELIEKIQQSKRFNQGFATVEFLAAAFLDMDWHTLSAPPAVDVLEFERQSLAAIDLIPEIVVRYRSPYFSHIFAGGYSAGYYSYIWSEVLDTDAFQAFKENGLFDPATAASFRRNILAAGGSEEPMTLYKRFRGAAPDIEPLLENRGLN